MAHVLLNRSYQGQIYQRWFPGHRYARQFANFGMGEIDPETGLELGGELPGGGIDFSSGETPDTTLYDQLIAEGVDPVDAAAYLPPGVEIDPETGLPVGHELPGGAPSDTSGETGGATALTPDRLAALLKAGVPLTAAQIAAAMKSGAVVPAAGVCASGYRYSTTQACVPGAAGSTTPPGQWVSFATNKQLITFGVVVFGTLILVNLIPSGGGRRRR